MIPILESFVYQEPPSIIIKFMPVITLGYLACLGISEIAGKHLQYSKFWNVNSSAKQKIKLSSRTGMLILYSPAFLAGLASFWVFPGGGCRFNLVKTAVTIHFFKRVLEVLFVHKYSGSMILDSVILISSSYFMSAAAMIYVQHSTQGSPEPVTDLKYLGLVLFLAGISGNFYHHYLLANLRKKDEKGYTIPRGGMFNVIICPHYLFEILTFIGISFISQTLLSFACSLGIALYLIGRSYATRKWYVSKFENFPKDVTAVIPYVF